MTTSEPHLFSNLHKGEPPPAEIRAYEAFHTTARARIYATTTIVVSVILAVAIIAG